MQTADKGGKFWLSNMQTMDKDFAFLGPQICKILDTAWRELPGASGYSKTPWEKNRLHTYRPSLSHQVCIVRLSMRDYVPYQQGRHTLSIKQTHSSPTTVPRVVDRT